MRLRERPIVEYGSRIADRNDVMAPVSGNLLDTEHHASGIERRAGLEIPRLVLPARENFDVSATHIDNQYVHDETFLTLNWPS